MKWRGRREYAGMSCVGLLGGKGKKGRGRERGRGRGGREGKILGKGR